MPDRLNMLRKMVRYFVALFGLRGFNKGINFMLKDECKEVLGYLVPGATYASRDADKKPIDYWSGIGRILGVPGFDDFRIAKHRLKLSAEVTGHRAVARWRGFVEKDFATVEAAMERVRERRRANLG